MEVRLGLDELKFELKPVKEKPSIRHTTLNSIPIDENVENEEFVRENYIPTAGKRFIESPRFPFAKISEVSASEKGPGMPPHWGLVFWWTRKPQISARAVIAGCLLPENTNPENFLKTLGVGFGKSAHRISPRLRFSGLSLLDPFAGFGSIPLEAARLGLQATAVELLPTAYVFLKSVLEYPIKFRRKLVRDVRRWGDWVIEELRKDPLIHELYDRDIAIYLGSWEVKCPNCGRWTPIIGNWWLARVKGKKGYSKLAWMVPEEIGDEIMINVKDLNKEFDNATLEEAKVEASRVILPDTQFRVPEKNIDARRARANSIIDLK